VRNETKIGNNAVSISSVAVDLAKTIFETWRTRQFSSSVQGRCASWRLSTLVSAGFSAFLVTNRTYERAVTFAEKFRGEAVPFGEMDRGLKQADIVLSATDSPQYLLRHDPVSQGHEGQKA